jgi:hypothetical protein
MTPNALPLSRERRAQCSLYTRLPTARRLRRPVAGPSLVCPEDPCNVLPIDIPITPRLVLDELAEWHDGKAYSEDRSLN